MTHTPLTRIELQNFTAFESLDLPLSPRFNVFVGTNGTGKTHLLKALYAAGASTQKEVHFTEKLVGVFKPHGDHLARLVRRGEPEATAWIGVERGHASIRRAFPNVFGSPSALSTDASHWKDERLTCVYIPVKEVLAQAPGFRSLYKEYELRFDETHVDLIDWALKPKRREAPDAVRQGLLQRLEQYLPGSVSVQGEEFFIGDARSGIEFTLLGEGLRKLGLLWQLIQNGTLSEGSILFWDEPEANLNPRVIGDVVAILLELARLGVQVFVATHDYVFLKELDLRKEPSDAVAFHALFRLDPAHGVQVSCTDALSTLEPNVIRETYLGLLDREAERDFKD
jgi:energy-coupling factor transporter ATP-binding protein EcfA2